MSTRNLKTSQKSFNNPTYQVFLRVCESLKITTQQELAEVLKISQNAVSNFLKRGWPKKRLEQISEMTGVSMAWLEYGEEASNLPVCPNHECQIPVYGGIPAGNASFIEETPAEYINFNEIMRPKDIRNCHIIKITGQSMNKMIPHGSYLAVQPLNGTPIVDGAAYVVVMPGLGVTCKRVFLHTAKIVLKPYSTDPSFEKIEVSKEELHGQDVVLYRIVKVLPSDEFLNSCLINQ